MPQAEKFRIALIQTHCAIDPNQNMAKTEWKIREAAAGGARARRHDLAEERALHALDLALATAGVAGRGPGAGRATRARALRAQHRLLWAHRRRRPVRCPAHSSCAVDAYVALLQDIVEVL